MSAAIREGRFDLDELMKTLKSSPETIGKAAKATLTLGDRLGIMRNKITLAAEPLGNVLMAGLEKLQPHLVRAIGYVAKFGKWFGNLPGPVQAAAAGFGVFLAAIGPILFVVGTLITNIGALIGVLGAGGLGLTFGGVVAAAAPFRFGNSSTRRWWTSTL